MMNPLGLSGISFVEFTSSRPEELHRLFKAFGFSLTHRNERTHVDLYRQNDIVFLLNRGQTNAAAKFRALHGPSISAMGWIFENPRKAFETAITRGARALTEEGTLQSTDGPVPAIYGIGESAIYFVGKEGREKLWQSWGFTALAKPDLAPEYGFISIDHLTNNVPSGTMHFWADFYKTIFGFTEVRYFDIRGVKTGLQSYALRSPDGSFCIPINEAKEEKSQINEYLREYNGPGIQHLAFLTRDILSSLDAMKGSGIQTLDIDDDYYAEAFQRVPNVTEDRSRIQGHKVLVDGDDQGYLLQIFTKNLVGPIFIEIIQRKNHLSFGEGNFAALFRSIERDQEKRGVLA